MEQFALVCTIECVLLFLCPHRYFSKSSVPKKKVCFLLLRVSLLLASTSEIQVRDFMTMIPSGESSVESREVKSQLYSAQQAREDNGNSTHSSILTVVRNLFYNSFSFIWFISHFSETITTKWYVGQQGQKRNIFSLIIHFCILHLFIFILFHLFLFLFKF